MAFQTSLRVPQVRILKALKRNPRGLTRSQIAEKAKVSPSMTANLGPVDTDQASRVDDHYGKKCLIGRKMVKAECADDESNQIVYKITAKGVAFLESLAAPVPTK